MDISDTVNKIRDDEEEQLDIQQEMEDIQIELYHNALDALETIREMHDLMAEMKGMWSGFELDSPFRAMVEDLQNIDPEYITLGSVALVLDGAAGLEVYMAKSDKTWVQIK